MVKILVETHQILKGVPRWNTALFAKYECIKRRGAPFEPERGRPAQSSSLLLTSQLTASLSSQTDDKRPN